MVTEETTTNVTQTEASGMRIGVDNAIVNTVTSLLNIDAGDGSPILEEQKKGTETTTVQRKVTSSQVSLDNMMASAKERGADYLLHGEIMQVILERPSTNVEEKTQKKEVVLRKEKYKDEDGKERERKIKGDVQVTVNHYTLRAKSTIRYSYQLVDVNTGAVWKESTLSDQHDYVYEWVRKKSGDDRALSSYNKSMMTKEPSIQMSATERSDALMLLAGETLAKELKPILQ